METTNLEASSIEMNPITRKPRLALMGEFSSGKSTLSNMLLGCAPLPVKITATRLPPVWISYGEERAFRVDLDGYETPLEIKDIPNIQLEETKLIKLFLKADALELCDLIDMPGISDPNMSSSVWENAVSEVDSVVWCTHATQAWRQSEAAAWELVKSKTNGNNLLIISQFDKLRTDRDRSRVLKRVRKETDGLFKGVFPVSLIDALNSDEDVEKWERSGAGKFTEELVEMLLSPPEFGTTTDITTDQIEPSIENDPLVSEIIPDSFENLIEMDALKANLSATPASENNFCENPPTAVVTPRRVRPSRKDKLPSRLTTPTAESIDPSEMMVGASESD